MYRWRLSRDPLWSDFEGLQKRMDDLMGVLSSVRTTAGSPLWTPTRLFPLVNVLDLGESFVVSAEIPGIKTDDLDIKFEGDTLSLKGERKPHDIGENSSYHRRERPSGTFQRSLTLPSSVDPEKVKATYKDGVLTVVLGKTTSASPKQITVTSE